MKRYVNILQIGTIILFMGLALMPMLNSQFGFIKEDEGNENRLRVEKPEYDINNLDRYTSAYDDYYTDNFSLRQNLISITNRMEYSLFNVSPVPGVVTVGKEGWLYATKSVDNYKGANLFSSSQLDKFRAEFKARTVWAKERGITYYIIVVPNKMTTYPEYVPNHVIKISDSTRYDQIISLDGIDGINLVGLKDNILKHKHDGNELYQRTDDHWNELGAYYGYEEIMNRLSSAFSQLKPLPLSDFEVVTKVRSGNMASIISVEDDNQEQMIELTSKLPVLARDGEIKGYKVSEEISEYEREIVKINDNTTGLKCLIIRDSFAMYLIKFLQNHFKKSVFIHDGWKYRMREDVIEGEQPDIVLNVVLETELEKLITFPFVKTAEDFYTELTTQAFKLEEIKQRAKEDNIAVEKMIRRTVLWLCENRDKSEETFKRTYLYYEYAYLERESLKGVVESVMTTEGLSFTEAAKKLAEKAVEEGLDI